MGNVLVPNPVDSDVQYARFYHMDLPYLDDMQLMDELYALRPLLWGMPPVHWLRERVKVLEGEITKRKWNTKSKSKIAKGMS